MRTATPNSAIGVQLADALVEVLNASGHQLAGKVHGSPPEVGEKLREWEQASAHIDVIACPNSVASWAPVRDVNTRYPKLGGRCRVMTPESYKWPTFLKKDNVLNIAQQISIIAIIAIGMTLVIITVAGLTAIFGVRTARRFE